MNLQAYNSIVNQYADNVYRFMHSMVRDEMLAQDLVQDAFEKLWKNKDTVAPEKAKSWLFTTAHRAWIDYLRRAKKQGNWEDIQEPESTHGYSDLQEVLQEGLNRLPDAQKQVVLLRDYEGYDYKEIGEITGLKESQVKVYIFRARKALKQYIGKIEYVL